MSLIIEDIITILRDGGHLTDPKALQQVAKDLIAAEKEVKDSKTTGVKTKTRLVGLLRSSDPAVKRAVEAGIVLISVPDDDSTSTYSQDALLQRFRAAVIAHNEAPRKRGKTRQIVTWQDAFTGLKAKTLKGCGSQIGVKAKGRPSEVVILASETVATP